MDPITLGAHALFEELRVLLSPPAPGQPAHAIARVSVVGTQITDLHKALRQYENKDWNTHPFVLLAFDVTDERDFLLRAKSQLRGDERSIRACLERAGVMVEPVEPPPGPMSIAWVCSFLQRLSERLSPHLDGLVVGLLPSSVADAALRDRVADALARIALQPALTVLLLDDDSERTRRLAPHTLRFHVDEKALWKYLREGKGQQQAGPPRADEPKLTPELRREVEKELGRALPSQDNTRVLRSLLFDAGEAYSQGKLEAAARKFRVARTYCQMLGLETERATCCVAVGSARFMMGQKPLALRAFEEGREIAHRAGAHGVVMQAELGIATTQLSLGAFGLAREAYARCGAIAEGNAAMAIECLRMRGQTFAAEGRMGDAIQTWLDALTEVEKLPPAARAGTGYKTIAAHLVDMLTTVGRAHEVPPVRSRVAAIDDAGYAALDAALEAQLETQRTETAAP